MDTAFQIIVIILSSFLGLFLILNIIFMVFAIKLVRSVRRVSQRAELLTEKAEAVSEFMQHAAGPVLVGKLFANLSDILFKKQAKTKRK